jgi:hypothetical protein
LYGDVHKGAGIASPVVPEVEGVLCKAVLNESLESLNVENFVLNIQFEIKSTVRRIVCPKPLVLFEIKFDKYFCL